MRFLQNDAAAKWAPKAALKSRATDGDVMHHNTLNANANGSDDEERRSREVEHFFDVMTASTAAEIAR